MSLPLPTPSDLAELGRLYNDARYLDGFRYAEKFAPPEAWPGAEGLILAGRYMNCWGDWERANRLHTAAWRIAPHDPTAVYYYSLKVHQRHGPFEALRFLHEQRAVMEPAETTLPHTWLWLHRARLLATFRDFEGAEVWLRRAQPMGAADPWWWVEQSRLLEQQDRYAEALDSIHAAFRLQPRYRPALEAQAHLLMLLNRDDEALAVLHDAIEHTQVGSLGQMLAVLLGELERHEEILPVLDRVAEVLPCANLPQRQWLDSRRSDALRLLGRDEEAAAVARKVGLPFFDRVAEKLAAIPTPRPRRVQLPVGFVRQHHMTCAPATLAAISHFWQRPVDHLELARLICYDGTPDHEERHWAETHGWLAREFTVTWETATALLDRGCPFTLGTVATRSAHLQAVVGYDALLGLLLIRDPYQRTHGECVADKFLAACASHGPRGMVLVPAERADLLDGLELPEAALYDEWYALRRALVRHDRAAAQAALDRLAAQAPGHRLTLHGQRELAVYDGNLLRQFESTRGLLALFPDDPNFRLDEVQYLRALGRTTECRERIAALVRKDPDALSLREYAQSLASDARTHRRAHRVYRRVLRRRAPDAGNLRAFANLLWDQHEFAAATEIHRLAACVGDKVEANWDSYFAASRHLRRSDECFTLLRQREQRLGAQSAQPTRTFFRACETLDRTTEGFAALEAALLRRPDDGELTLFAAECRGRFGQLEESARLLAAARPQSPPLPWLRVAARLAEIRTDHAAALGYYRELLTLNPIDVDALGAIARLLATLEGRAAALDFLRAAAAQHPTLIPLHTLLLEWLRSELPEEALQAIDHLLSLDANNAWALREKALILGRLNRPADAIPLAETACQIEPNSHTSAGVLGFILVSHHRPAEARAAYETSIRVGLSAYYMGELMNLGEDFATRCATIQFFQAELERQPVPEDLAFLRFRELARAVLSPEDTEAALKKILAAHTDKWAAWSAYGTHLVDQGKADAALSHTRESTERFPLVARLWLDLAAAQGNARQPEAEIESLRRALELAPSWSRASRALADAHERALQLDAAEHVLRRALAAEPLDISAHAYLADLLWRRKQQTEAVTLVKRAITIDPTFDWGWDHLNQWAASTGEPKLALDLAQAITRSRPGDVQAWVRLARLQTSTPEEALATLERALAINPRDVETHEFRANMLSSLGRQDEAIAACRPEVFGEKPPLVLQGRAIWIEHTRGHTAVAITQMRQLLQAHPDYVWGWSCLTEWAWETNDAATTLEAARKWAWLAPTRAVPLGYASIAQQKMGHRKEAKDALWRALEREPGYDYGANTLLRWLAEDGAVEEAQRLLRHIETHLTPADAKRSQVLFEVMRLDQAAAGKALVELVGVMGERTHLLRECITALQEARWHKLIAASLEPLLSAADTPVAVATHWVGTWAPQQKWGKLKQLEERGVPEPMLRQAWAVALEAMGQQHRIWRLRWLRYRRGPWLREKETTWAALGFALLAAGSPRAAVTWLKDWAGRKELQPWMLYNLVISYYKTKRPQEVAPIITHALALPADNTRVDFLLWQGLESALRADLPAAEEALAQTNSPSLDLHAKTVRLLTQLLVDFHQNIKTRPVDRVLGEAKNRLDTIWSENPGASRDPALRHFRARTLRHLGTHASSWLTRVQSYVPSVESRAPSPAARESSGFSFSYIWIIFVIVSVLSRSCSGH